MTRLLAIDPGNEQSAYVIIDDARQPTMFEKLTNFELLEMIKAGEFDHVGTVAIEMIASYGMTVGAEVFETCVWIGRFYQALNAYDRVRLAKRLPIKMHHCHTTRATDANIRQALVDRFAKGQPNHGKGTKKNPGWFYGFSNDVWQAYALAVYAMDVDEGVAAA